MVILNTCHIRDRAAEKVFSELGRLRVIKEARAEAGQDTVLAVAGCVAQAEGARDPGPRALCRHRARARRPTTGCRRWWREPPAPAAP